MSIASAAELALDHALNWPTARPRLVLLVVAVITVIAGIAARRLEPVGSLDVMISRNDPAAVALGRLATHFELADELLVVATVQPGVTSSDASQQLFAFAERFHQAIISSPDAAPLVSRYRGGSYDPVAASMRRYIESQWVPNAMLLLDDHGFARVLERLSPESMRRQMQRNQRMLAAPGPAADRLTQTLLRDPLRLREIMLEYAARAGLPIDALRDSGAGTLSRDGRNILISIAGREPLGNLEFSRRFVAEMARAAASANQDGLQLQYTGGYAIAVASERSIRADMIASVIGAVVAMQILFLVMYRRWSRFLLAFLPTALGILVAFAVFALGGLQLTPATAVVGAVLAGLGVDFSIHYLSHVDQHRNNTMHIRDAARHASRLLWRPMCAAALTSIVGLSAVMQSSVPALRDFALLAGMGVLFSLLATLIVLPALLVALEHAPSAGHRLSMHPLVHLIVRRPRVCIGAAFLLMAIAGFVLAWNGRFGLEHESDPHVMHPQPNPALQLQEVIPSDFSIAAESLFVHCYADSPQALVVQAHQVREALVTDDRGRQAGVAGVMNLAALLPDSRTIESRLARLRAVDVDSIIMAFAAIADEHGFDPAGFESFTAFLRSLLRPGDLPTIDMVLAFPDLAQMLFPRDVINGAEAATESLNIVMIDRPMRTQTDREQVIAALRSALAPIEGATLTGMDVLAMDTQRQLRHEMQWMLGVAAVAVTALVFVFFPSWRDVALALTPLVFGMIVTMAALQQIGDRLNPINLIGVPLVLGIGVDYGLYAVALARQHQRARDSATTFISDLAGSMHALTMTWLTTLAGFGSLIFTSTPAIASLGRLAGVGVMACFLGAVLLLIPLLILRLRRTAASHSTL